MCYNQPTDSFAGSLFQIDSKLQMVSFESGLITHVTNVWPRQTARRHDTDTIRGWLTQNTYSSANHSSSVGNLLNIVMTTALKTKLDD